MTEKGTLKELPAEDDRDWSNRNLFENKEFELWTKFLIT